MKLPIPYILSLILAVLCYDAGAQFSVKPSSEVGTIDISGYANRPLSVPGTMSAPLYTTKAMIEAQKRILRKERNTFNFTGDLGTSQIFFNNWSKGGDNTFNGTSSVNIMYKYQRDKFSLTNRFNARLGVNVVDTVVYKYEDKFDANILAEWKINDSWSYSGNVILKSQFMKGYKSMTNHTLVSDFMAPGNLNVGIGFSYQPKNKKIPLKITISPIAGEALFVRNDELSAKGAFNIDKGKHFKPKMGPLLDAYFHKKFAKEVLEFRSKLTSFYNFNYSPNVRWENEFNIIPVKFLTIKFYGMMIYDEGEYTKSMSGYLQFNYSAGVAFRYTYKNK